MFAQPETGFYRKPALYWSGKYTEIDQVRQVRSFSETDLCVAVKKGCIRIEGQDLVILTLEAGRLLITGRIHHVEFIFDESGKDGMP